MPQDDSDELRIKAAQPPHEPEADAQGHSMQIYELGRTMHGDRVREAEKAARKARLGEQPKKERRGFFRRG